MAPDIAHPPSRHTPPGPMASAAAGGGPAPAAPPPFPAGAFRWVAGWLLYSLLALGVLAYRDTWLSFMCITAR